MTDQLVHSLYVETYQSSKLIESVSKHMNNALVAQRTLIFTDYKSKKYQNIYQSYLANLKEAKEKTALAKGFILENDRMSSNPPSGDTDDLPRLIDSYSSSFEQWETRSNTIIESMSTRGLRGEDKLVFQSLILEEAIAADEKFNAASRYIQQLETVLGERSAAVTQDITQNKRKLQTYLIVVTGLTFVLALALGLLVSRKMLRSIMQLVQLTKKVARGDLSTDKVTVSSSDEIGLLTTSFVSMCNKLSQYIDLVYIGKIKENEAELKALQWQIQPHFLFNTLEVIRMKAIKSGEKQIADMVHILANIFRWNVKGRNSIVSLEEELEYTLSYVNLQRIRFQERTRLEVDFPPDAMLIAVPKLILQPLVENAINHGFNRRSDSCVVRLSGVLDNGTLVISCTDNGDGIQPEALNSLRQHLGHGQSPSDNIGLKNVHSRISLLFGSPYGLEVDSRPGEGTTITLRFPANPYYEVIANHV
ncbi:sensor histidine kinase [Paenibacillaceae bacterium WGS1546]|uniref:sensor histidine kinase n=1 Tax=Cohnella sp. WGS1546 TaxID=3366810 RepID=UPI00372D45BD